MNQEENKNIMFSTSEVNRSANVTGIPSNQNEMLAGSPGIVIAPVSGQSTSASMTDKAGATNVTSQPVNVSSPVQTPIVNSTVVPPKNQPAATQISSSATINQGTSSNAPLSPTPQKTGKGKFFILFLLFIILGLGSYIYIDYKNSQGQGQCSPLISSDNTERTLDLNSSIVQELYAKVKTSVREDLAYNTFDDTLKIYLAYRQIPHSEMYASNCNLFNESSMSNFTCTKAVNFTPMAFSEETLAKEIKKLFGESVSIPNQNIVLGNSCFGGYQYIAERGEYVEGYCGQVPTTTYNVDKELISASVQGDMITLREKVRYYSAQGITTERLKNGIYVHSFKLDNHYHYAYVSRAIEETS